MRKIIYVFMIFACLLFSSACGIQGENADTGDVSDTSTEVSNAVQEDAAISKVLVVYYSATGSTKKVAETIAANTGANIFEIVPEKPYTDEDLNWTDDNSRVCMEHNDESMRNITLVNAVPDDWEQYDTVYIGYPIWWGIAAWPMNGFVKANDFIGKTVIPFCTSASSGIGDSAKWLEDMCGGGNWLAGKRFSSFASESEITAWIEETVKP